MDFQWLNWFSERLILIYWYLNNFHLKYPSSFYFCWPSLLSAYFLIPLHVISIFLHHFLLKVLINGQRCYTEKNVWESTLLVDNSTIFVLWWHVIPMLCHYMTTLTSLVFHINFSLLKRSKNLLHQLMHSNYRNHRLLGFSRQNIQLD